MLQSLFDKMTNKMLWWLVIPTAILISALAILTGAYARVAWNANKVSYEGPFGTLTANIENAQSQVQETSAFLEQQQTQLKLYSNQIEKLLSRMKYQDSTNSVSAKQQASGYIAETVTDLSGIATNLKVQSNMVVDQKKKLEAVSHDLQQFKQELNQHSEYYKKIQ
jgi:peptidoglycan hydrolase CwlO-like protein